MKRRAEAGTLAHAMGNEATCRARVDGKAAQGKALLEGDEVILRGETRARVKVAPGVEVTVAKGWLKLVHAAGVLELELGDQAETWAKKLLHPKSVVDKLGVKAGQRVALVGEHDAALVEGLRARGAVVSVGAPRSAVDVIFLAAEDARALGALEKLKARLVPNGGLWVIRPKGSDRIHERDVMAAGKAAGLVDVKVVKVSEALTAEKLVIPVAKRLTDDARRRTGPFRTRSGTPRCPTV